MVVLNNLPQKIKTTVENLPIDKQQEVYDFAEYLKSKVIKQVSQKASITNLIGIVDGPEDLSSNHDEIYD